VVTLALTRDGRDLVDQVQEWRHGELSRILASLAPADRETATRALRQLVAAVGDGYRPVRHRLALL
jgi:DNA-binding MarR family transcriptional regulator